MRITSSFCILATITVIVTSHNEEEDDVGMASTFKKTNPAFKTGYSRGNSMYLDGLDMIISQQQMNELYDTGRDRDKRGGTTRGTKVWPNGLVKYTIKDGDFKDAEKAEILEAMEVIEGQSCVTFEEKTGTVKENYVNFQNHWSGCNSMLGMRGDKQQDINLAEGGCRRIGIYIHEILHALGMIHEHQLPTRDSYVKYQPVNLDPTQIMQLRKYSEKVTETYGSLYDLSSIMHYELYGFSIDGEGKPLGINNPWFEKHIGRRDTNRMSFGDVKVLNRMYECKNKCQGGAASCPEPGFINKECECITPEIYYDRTCRNDPAKEPECYETLKTGQCYANSELMRKCGKACDLCPRFLPGQTALDPAPDCADHYSDTLLCQKWAAEGDCEKPNYFEWMKAHCTKSCNLCGQGFGGCPDKWMTATCVESKKRCSKDGWSTYFTKKRCQGTCQLCGFRSPGKCDNREDDDECQKRMLAGECDGNSEIMYYDCPKTCNRCDYQAGSCNNTPAEEEKCKQLATLNYCLGGYHYKFMTRNCLKACNKCPEDGNSFDDYTKRPPTTTGRPRYTRQTRPTQPPPKCEDTYADPTFCPRMEPKCTHETWGAYLHRECRKTCNAC